MYRESKYSIEKQVQLIFSYLQVTLRNIKGLKKLAINFKKVDGYEKVVILRRELSYGKKEK